MEKHRIAHTAKDLLPRTVRKETVNDNMEREPREERKKTAKKKEQRNKRLQGRG